MSEAQTQRLILDWLAAKGILSFRMNTGAVKVDKRFLRFGTPGMADILAFPVSGVDRLGNWCECIVPIWIEVKAPKGVQSELQKSFQKRVETEGHSYILARDLDAVIEAMR